LAGIFNAIPLLELFRRLSPLLLFVFSNSKHVLCGSISQLDAFINAYFARAETLNKLVKIWIAAIEKARYTEREREAGRDNVWPIATKAKVHMFFTASRKTWQDSNGNPVLELNSTHDHTKLEKLESSDVDEIFLYENGVDVRIRMLRKLSAQTQLIFREAPR